jgi:hypothetical protein
VTKSPRMLAALACLSIAMGAMCTPADARLWKPKSTDLALDYSEIVDNRGGGEIVISWWFAPPAVGQYPAAKDMLDRYVVVGLAHSHMSPGGEMVFETDAVATAKDGSGNTLNQIPTDKLPPMVSGSLMTMEGMLKQSIGAMGNGIHWMVFDNGALHACSKSGLSIQYAGETYTYETPIPGCPAN